MDRVYSKHGRQRNAEECEMGSVYSKHGRERNAYKILVRKLEGKRQLGIPRHRWEDSITMED
jgi:hypothetical protein